MSKHRLPPIHIAVALLIVSGLCSCAGSKRETIVPAIAGAEPRKSSDTVLAERFPDGRLRYLILATDSAGCRELHLAFYANGRLKSKGCQGTVTNMEVSTGMSVGTWSYFDSLSGIVDSTFFYDNSESAKAFIEKRTFYPDGQLKSVERFNNYILYETELQKKGAPKYYDEHGMLQTVR